MLLDYVSCGPFEIYEQLVREARELTTTEGLEAWLQGIAF